MIHGYTWLSKAIKAEYVFFLLFPLVCLVMQDNIEKHQGYDWTLQDVCMITITHTFLQVFKVG